MDSVAQSHPPAGTGGPAAVLRRPIGWWLKEADAALDAAFETAVGGHAGPGRRGWQVLTTLAAGPTGRSQVAAALARFDDAGAIDALVDDLVHRGWIVDGDPLMLTERGRDVETSLADRVGAVRRRVADALPDGDYDTLVQLLARLVAAVR